MKWKIKYIIPKIEPKVIASRYSVDENNKPLFLHMWWLREWFSKSVEPYLKVSNYSRYKILENDWLMAEFSDFSSRFILLKQQIVARKSRISRLLKKLKFKVQNGA